MGAADHLVDRHLRDAGFDVPREEIDEAEMLHVQFFDPIDFPDERPQPLGHQRVLADENFQTAPRQAGNCLAVAELEAAGHAGIRIHPEDCGDRLPVRRGAVAGAGQPLPPAERIGRMRILDQIAADIGDLHGWPPYLLIACDMQVA